MSNFLKKLIAKENLSHNEMTDLMKSIMSGGLSPNYVSAILTALSIKGETIDEISAAAQVLRDNLTPVDLDDDVVDTCGTGGDGLKTFNISTCASFVAAGAGVRIAKHGGRSISSSSGSADVLESLGVNVSIDNIKMKELVDSIGIGFMFAPNFHPAMKYVAPIRKDLGIRTIFNVLGPLANPANAKRQVIGVFNKSLTSIFSEVLKKLESKKVLVVHGHDGMDEISMSGETFISELDSGSITNYEIHPNDFGFNVEDNKHLFAADVNTSKEIILKILNKEDLPAKNIVLLNSAAIIYVAGLANNLNDAIELAVKSIKDGSALSKLKELAKESNE
ncbi:anthranilate phosphoribosyltransferase [Methylophilales bacterium MBRSG12]|uniref:Anthranilate phosphoribosyltransferase n=1 Tax=Methylophilales bacterium MBRS-H7 TaxID=1623450 RepID=A0A0H4IZI6_9PROT|nr:anthranilate phosphoribosyltransferase [Methylophilales bacterium MBRSF5]AKO65914.1 anthranilate phosphoribosyltransferase [Methylophilales bacterium MBRS-H7]AKO67234.1 anthranilate phosphoribosyltransferase [Methylophilales bacterium MBRSG12]